ncbi:MAG: hypothetical protein MUP45_04580 [Candidatus Marinimicrobia bacterium]|nr:hypothetical protein [Candidatus Neomarinimicrobiota bacterium]
MTEKNEEIIVQKAFVVDPKTGKVTETSRTIMPEQGASKAKEVKTHSELESARGVFENPENVPAPMDKELDEIKGEKRHRMRGRLLKEMGKLGLDRRNPIPSKKK